MHARRQLAVPNLACVARAADSCCRDGCFAWTGSRRLSIAYDVGASPASSAPVGCRACLCDADGRSSAPLQLTQFTVPAGEIDAISAGPGFCEAVGSHRPYSANELDDEMYGTSQSHRLLQVEVTRPGSARHRPLAAGRGNAPGGEHWYRSNAVDHVDGISRINAPASAPYQPGSSQGVSPALRGPATSAS